MQSNWEMSDLRVYLYSTFIINKTSDTMSIEQIARSMGLSESTIYKYLEGSEKTPPPEFFPALYNITKNIGIIAWFINRCEGLKLIISDKIALNGDIRDELEELVIMVGKVSEMRRIAYADGRMDSNEKQRLLKSANKLYKIVSQLLEEIKNIEV